MIRTFGSSALCVKELALALCYSILQRVLKPQLFVYLYIFWSGLCPEHLSCKPLSGVGGWATRLLRRCAKIAGAGEWTKYDEIWKHHETSWNIMKHHEASWNIMKHLDFKVGSVDIILVKKHVKKTFVVLPHFNSHMTNGRGEETARPKCPPSSWTSIAVDAKHLCAKSGAWGDPWRSSGWPSLMFFDIFWAWNILTES